RGSFHECDKRGETGSWHQLRAEQLPDRESPSASESPEASAAVAARYAAPAQTSKPSTVETRGSHAIWFSRIHPWGISMRNSIANRRSSVLSRETHHRSYQCQQALTLIGVKHAVTVAVHETENLRDQIALRARDFGRQILHSGTDIQEGLQVLHHQLPFEFLY